MLRRSLAAAALGLCATSAAAFCTQPDLAPLPPAVRTCNGERIAVLCGEVHELSGPGAALCCPVSATSVTWFCDGDERRVPCRGEAAAWDAWIVGNGIRLRCLVERQAAPTAPDPAQAE